MSYALGAFSMSIETEEDTKDLFDLGREVTTLGQTNNDTHGEIEATVRYTKTDEE